MSYIESISQASTTTTTTTATASDVALGKQDFLTLLVAQLQNQDPLNPDDPTEFTAQLAQFSSLEQLFNLNETMESVATSIENSDRMGALQTIGKEVAYESSTFEYNGTDVEVGYSIDGTATDVSVYLQYNGTTIATYDATDLSEGAHYFTFDGTTDSGATAPYGDYDIIIKATSADGSTLDVTTLVKSEVTGVDLDGEDGGTLETYAGSTSYNAILGVYDKSASSSSATTDTTDTDDESSDDDSIIEEVADTAVDAVDDAIEEAI